MPVVRSNNSCAPSRKKGKLKQKELHERSVQVHNFSDIKHYELAEILAMTRETKTAVIKRCFPMDGSAMGLKELFFKAGKFSRATSTEMQAVLVFTHRVAKELADNRSNAVDAKRNRRVDNELKPLELAQKRFKDFDKDAGLQGSSSHRRTWRRSSASCPSSRRSRLRPRTWRARSTRISWATSRSTTPGRGRW